MGMPPTKRKYTNWFSMTNLPNAMWSLIFPPKCWANSPKIEVKTQPSNDISNLRETFPRVGGSGVDRTHQMADKSQVVSTDVTWVGCTFWMLLGYVFFVVQNHSYVVSNSWWKTGQAITCFGHSFTIQGLMSTLEFRRKGIQKTDWVLCCFFQCIELWKNTSNPYNEKDWTFTVLSSNQYESVWSSDLLHTKN